MLYIICYVSSTYNIRLLFQVQYLFYSTRYPLKPHMPSSQELNLTRKGYIKVEESAICLVCKNHLISTILPTLIVVISVCIKFITNMQRSKDKLSVLNRFLRALWTWKWYRWLLLQLFFSTSFQSQLSHFFISGELENYE